MDLDSIRELYRHQAWADAEMWRAVLDSRAARDDAELRRRLLHFHVTQEAFLQIWQGRDPELPEEGAFADGAQLCDFARRGHEELAAFLAGLAPECLHEAVRLPWPRGPKAAVELLDTALQVVLHSQHHRGQAASALRALGGVPLTIDYLAWVWKGRPDARWP